MTDWSKFDEKVDLKALRDDVADAEEGGAGFPDVPLGTYEVRIEKMELGETGPKSKNPGSPMLKAQMRILAGEYEKSCLFYNQVVSAAFGIHKANEFLRSLDSGVDVEFESYAQFEQMVLDVAEAVDACGLEYAIEYGENKSGYSEFKVLQVFETK